MMNHRPITSLEDLPARLVARHRRRLERDSERLLPATAHHEAGHALAALVFPFGQQPLGVARVSVVPELCSRGGRFLLGWDSLGVTALATRLDFQMLSHNRELAEAYFIHVFAGPAATFRFQGRNAWTRCEELEGGKEHVEFLLQQYGRGNPAEYTRWLQARASVFVESVWPAIVAVAAELQARRELDGGAVEAIWQANRDGVMLTGV